MKILKSVFFIALLMGSTVFVSCDDEDESDDSCLVCDAFEDEDGFSVDAIDICAGEEDEYGDTITQDDIDLARTFAELFGASCN